MLHQCLQLPGRCRYWLPERPGGDFRALRAWADAHAVALATSVTGVACGAERCAATLQLNNTDAAAVAFWVKLALVDECGAGCTPTCAKAQPFIRLSVCMQHGVASLGKVALISV